MKKRKRCVKIIGILMVAGLLLLSGCDSLTKITKLTADEKLKVAIIDRRKETLKEAIEDKADVNKLPYALGEMTDNGQYERRSSSVVVLELGQSGYDKNAAGCRGGCKRI